MTKPPPPFPTRQQVTDFLRDRPEGAEMREIARAFHITGERRRELRALLAELKRDGTIEPHRPRRPPKRRHIPDVLVLEAFEIDEDGDLFGRPVAWEHEDPPPRIHIGAAPGVPAMGVGQRALCRLSRSGPYAYHATPIKILAHAPQRIVGVFEKARDGAGGWLKPGDRRDRDPYAVPAEHAADAQAGEIVAAEPLPARRHGPRLARIVERLGVLGEARSVSLMSILAHEIPVEFSQAALRQAEAAEPLSDLSGRADLRAIPLVTIDGEDARDFDDAVYAEPDADPANPGGWRLTVAIADVALYVTPHSPLDKDARERGNSVYFPDRVVPMLPEALSNGLCSLRPHEDRACMAAHIWIDAQGRKLSHRFVRGVMRSTARLTYAQIQAAYDGEPDEVTTPLLDKIVRPLYGAWKALDAAKRARGAMDLDLVEKQVKLDPETSAVLSIAPRPRHDSCRLIEEFMILANVCAAETLETTRQLCMYRIHDEPSAEKLDAARLFLSTLDLTLVKGQVVQPVHFTRIVEKVRGGPYELMVNETLLRTQAQAKYSPDNIGHFGLALRRYAHFTSPIRRYADLLVHRALITGLGLGDDGLPPGVTLEDFIEIGDAISATERRAAQAEREAVDRYLASFLSAQVGAVFPGRIAGVERFGLFVRLDDTGADGLVPISSLPQDFYLHDDTARRLVGERHGLEFRLGDKVEARLADADTITGGMVFQLVPPEGGWPRRGGGRAGRLPARISKHRPKPGGGKKPGTRPKRGR